MLQLKVAIVVTIQLIFCQALENLEDPLGVQIDPQVHCNNRGPLMLLPEFHDAFLQTDLDPLSLLQCVHVHVDMLPPCQPIQSIVLLINSTLVFHELLLRYLNLFQHIVKV